MTTREKFQLATQHHQANRLEEAERTYLEILAAAPNRWDVLHRLGIAAIQTGRIDRAIEMLNRAIALKPDFNEAISDLGLAFYQSGRTDEAIEAYRRALAIDPNHPEAHNNLGLALRTRHEYEAAVEWFRRALSVQPDYPSAQQNLVVALQDAGRLTEATDACQKRIDRNPGDADAWSTLANILKESGAINDALGAYQRSLQLGATPASCSAWLLALHFLPGADPRAVYTAHRQFNDLFAAPLSAKIAPHTNDRTPDRTLRVGYVSPDFRGHPVATFFENLLAAHDPAQVQTFCYADVRAPDRVTARLKASAHNWRETISLDDQQLADLIREDRIDILVDLAGHTDGNRLLVFARKPAPIQVSYLGYVGTTGLAAMDYRLTDEHLDPPGATEAFHSEKLVRLPGTFACYRPPDDAPPASPLPADSCGAVTFGSLNALAKLTPITLDCWAKILAGVADSRLLLVARGLADGAIQARILKAFAAHQIDPSRIEFVGEQSFAEYLAIHARIDVLLDPFPVNGHTITCNAIWMGVPPITLAGRNYASRLGVSVLSNLGLSELIAADPGAYVEIATSLAGDRSRLAELRRTSRDRMAQWALMDAHKQARNMERMLREMWHGWLR